MTISRILRRMHLPLMLLLGAFSPLMFFLGRIHPTGIISLLLFPAAYILFAALLTCVPGRTRMPLYVIGCALLIGGGFVHFQDNLMLVLMPSIGAAALFFALPFADKSPAEASPFFYMGTLLTQLFTLFLLHFSTDYPAARAVLEPLLLGVFVVYLLLLLLSLSRISLNNATLARYRLPAVISRTSTTMTVCFFVLSLALSSLPAVIQGVYTAFRLLRSGMEQLLLFLINLLPQDSAGGHQGGPMPMLPQGLGLENAAPSKLALFFEKVAEILTFIVLIVGSILLVRLLARLLIKLARHLLNRLQQYGTAISEDYEDEITDTRLEEADRSFGLLRQRIARRQTAYPDTPAGSIRRSYARLMREHSEWKSGSTARENLPESASALYERARYSTHPVTQQEADSFRQETRKL